MKINKILFFHVFIFLILGSAQKCFSLTPIQPVPKSDAPGDAAITTVSTTDTSQTSATGIKKVALDVKNWVVGAYEDVSEWTGSQIESGKALYADVQSAQSSATSIVSSGKTMYSDITDTGKSIAGSVSDINVVKKATVMAEYKAVKNDMDKRKIAITEEANANKAAAESNVNTLQAMYDAATDEQTRSQIQEQLQKAQQELSKYQEIVQQLENNPNDYLQKDKEYAALYAKLQPLQKQLQEIKKNNTQLAIGIGVAFVTSLLAMSDSDRRGKYDQVLGDNFLAKNEDSAPENIWRVMKHRKQELYNEIKYVFKAASDSQIAMEKKIDEIERIRDNMVAVDYKQTSINMLIQQRIIDIDILYNYTQLVIAELRLRTARNMTYLPAKRWNYDKDPSVLNLDDYVFTEKDIGTDSKKKNPIAAALGL